MEGVIGDDPLVCLAPPPGRRTVLIPPFNMQCNSQKNTTKHPCPVNKLRASCLWHLFSLPFWLPDHNKKSRVSGISKFPCASSWSFLWPERHWSTPCFGLISSSRGPQSFLSSIPRSSSLQILIVNFCELLKRLPIPCKERL